MLPTSFGSSNGVSALYLNEFTELAYDTTMVKTDLVQHMNRLLTRNPNTPNLTQLSPRN